MVCFQETFYVFGSSSQVLLLVKDEKNVGLFNAVFVEVLDYDHTPDYVTFYDVNRASGNCRRKFKIIRL